VAPLDVVDNLEDEEYEEGKEDLGDEDSLVVVKGVYAIVVGFRNGHPFYYFLI
jgi:hypothetical protein